MASQFVTRSSSNYGWTTLGLQEIIITVVFSCVATFAVAGRFWARYLNAYKPVLDDYLLIGGLIFTWGYAAGNIVFAYNGLGEQAEDLLEQGRANALQNQLKLLIANQVTYALALGLVKTSIVLSLKRIFSVFPTFKRIANLIIIFCIAWAIQTILIAFLICRPLSYNWDQVNKTGTCGNLTVAYVSIGIVDVVTDITIFILPLPMIHRLNMRRSSKWATMSIFGLGVFTIAAGIARTVMVVKTRFNPTNPDGPTQNLIWAIIEPCVAIMVASLLVIKPLLLYFRQGFSNLLSTLPSSRSRSTKQESGISGRGVGGKVSASNPNGSWKWGFVEMNADNASERRLNEEHGLKDLEGKIWQTTEVQIDDGVTVSSSRPGSGEGKVTSGVAF